MTFSISASNPLFPELTPRLVDPLWFKVDPQQDENAELTKLEKEHSGRSQHTSFACISYVHELIFIYFFDSEMLKSIGERDTALLPIGKTSETDEDSEDDDDVSSVF